MIASAHIAAGAAVGLIAGRLTMHPVARAAIAFGSGILSHIILDAIPHADYRGIDSSIVAVFALTETLVMFAILTLMLRGKLLPGWQWSLLPAIAGAMAPDARFPAELLLSPEMTHTAQSLGHAFHSSFHAPPPHNTAAAWAIEISAAVIALAYVRRHVSSLRV